MCGGSQNPAMNNMPQAQDPTQAPAPAAAAPTSVWLVLGSLGASACSAVAAYRAFHGYSALGWAVAIGLFMLLCTVARGLPSRAASTASSHGSGALWVLAVSALALSGWLAFQTFGVPGPRRVVPGADAALIDATLRRDAGAAQKALDDLPDRGRLLTVSAEAAAKVLSAEQRARLDRPSDTLSLVSFALAAGDLPLADLLLAHGHLMRHADRHLLAGALARADAQQRSRWQELMLELSQYRDRRLEALQSKGADSTLDQIVVRGMLRQQADFLPRFDEADAREALQRCDAQALEFIIDQAPDKGHGWALDLGWILARLREQDRLALESPERARSPELRRAAERCLEVSWLVLDRARLRGADGGSYVFDGLLGHFSWDDETSKLIDAYTDLIRADLRANAGLRDFDDSSFDLARTRRYLADRPPPYPHTLKFMVQLMQVSPQAVVLRDAFRSPLFYFYHPAFQQDAQLALQTWRASEASQDMRRVVQAELPMSARAYADEGVAHEPQKAALRRWLSDAGLRCNIRKPERTWPGQVMIGFKC